MAIVLFRIDDRLIHGQVVASWLKSLPARVIIVIDDATARDPFLRDVLRMAAPQGVDVEVFDVESGVARALAAVDADEPAYVIVRSPATALAVRERGVAFDSLNLGALGKAPGRRRIHRSFAASDDELATLQHLQELGVNVTIQAVPEDRPLALTGTAAAR